MPVEFFGWCITVLLTVLVVLALAKIILLTRYVNASDQILDLAKGWYRMTMEKHKDTQKVAEAIVSQSQTSEAVQKLPEIIRDVPEKTAVKVVEKMKEERENDSLPGTLPTIRTIP